MGFLAKIKEDILVASARHCCVCHRYKVLKIEVHNKGFLALTNTWSM
jgi:hypothetical protein